ncbi:MAG TPA: diguanylate cyclase, partial [Burkholderiales bacterium]|nr:diguanylate cyclase [Burkholderiales bacterium]
MAVQSNLETPTQSLFNDAAADMLSMLRAHLGFRLWIIGRVKGGDWLVSIVEGQAYGIRAGHSFRWSDTFCARMVAGLAPRFAADAQSIPQYAGAPLATEFRIGSYLGFPLSGPDGRLLGTLCAFDPAPHEPIAMSDQNMVETCARILARILHADVRAAKQTRRLERTEAVAFCDALTGLYNRRGWDQLIKAEESRCRRHGRSACVMSIDLDDLKLVNDSAGHDKGDDLIRRAAHAVRTTIRTQDVAARVGGDEFAILAVECDAAAVAAFKSR